MNRLFRFFRRARQWRSRSVSLLLFALQGVIALSPVWEPQEQSTPRAHAEQPGTRHVAVHNEANCAVCSVRSMHASVPPAVFPAIVFVQWRPVAGLTAIALSSCDGALSHLSRAPPLLS